MNTERFTIDGHPALESHLRNVCEQVRFAVTQIIPPESIQAIVLGGGYGRGEGGVLRTTGSDAPYNDLEFYVCVSGSTILNERRYGAALHREAEHLSAIAGIEVEFKLSSLDRIRRSPVTMFLYDLAMGHKVIHGNVAPLLHPRFSDASRIPPYEATRLMMNRCSGLLFAAEQLERADFNAENADFVGRNQAKAQLGFGDALLAANGQYHWSCRERNRRLHGLSAAQQLSPDGKLQCHHALGVEFKLHPQKKSGDPVMFRSLQAELVELAQRLWLRIESDRLQTRFQSIHDYVFSPVNKCPETNPLKNLLINLRLRGPSSTLIGNATRYPRERLFNALCLLLWEPRSLQDKDVRQKLQCSLQTNARDFAGMVAAYRSLWHRFN